MSPWPSSAFEWWKKSYLSVNPSWASMPLEKENASMWEVWMIRLQWLVFFCFSPFFATHPYRDSWLYYPLTWPVTGLSSLIQQLAGLLGLITERRGLVQQGICWDLGADHNLRPCWFDALHPFIHSLTLNQMTWSLSNCLDTWESHYRLNGQMIWRQSLRIVPWTEYLVLNQKPVGQSTDLSNHLVHSSLLLFPD